MEKNAGKQALQKRNRQRRQRGYRFESFKLLADVSIRTRAQTLITGAAELFALFAWRKCSFWVYKG
jgi:hypothetical protein